MTTLTLADHAFFLTVALIVALFFCCVYTPSGPKYRPLVAGHRERGVWVRGDIIQAGDEYRFRDYGEWWPVDSSHIGGEYGAGQMRRPLDR